MQQKHFRIHDVIIKVFPSGITKTVKSHEIVGALQGYTDEQFLYMHTVDGNTLEIGIYDEREV
jgi:hypothetical protein